MLWEIKTIDLEISSACNAACPCCSRQWTPGALNPHVKFNSHLPLSFIEKLSASFAPGQIKSVILCGNYGDPLAHPQRVEIFRLIRESFPKACLVVHTNGSIGTLEQWREIAAILRGTSHKVRFSIDGLEDTLPIYRKNVQYKQVLKNAQEFIAAGGNAYWKWIDFAHTRHQMEESRRLSRELGFADFVVIKDHSNFDENYTKQDFSYYERHTPFENESYSKGTIFEESACRAAKSKQIYIDSQGKIWPCCWLADGASARDAWKREAMRNELRKWPHDFNCLYTRPLDEIIAHPFFDQSLSDHWKNPLPSNCGRICLFHCAQISPNPSSNPIGLEADSNLKFSVRGIKGLVGRVFRKHSGAR